ncbi:hypothetical protein CF70_004545 [Cupriavidus sp. SK-3]|nr:hypothetical protein CF70_004545 [Cupriavidus sp. SK-3]
MPQDGRLPKGYFRERLELAAQASTRRSTAPHTQGRGDRLGRQELLLEAPLLLSVQILADIPLSDARSLGGFDTGRHRLRHR